MLSSDQKKLASTAIMVAIGCALAWYFLVDHNSPQPQPQVAQQLKRPEPKDRRQPVNVADPAVQPEARPLPPPVSVLKRRQLPATTQPIDAANSRIASDTTTTAVPVEEVDPVTLVEPAVPLQVARLALGFVGADPQAEEVWYEAINDPNTPPDARKDLIEDLNEEGFANPRQITEDDLPLIYSRIALIEQVAGDAMDDVNAAAFEEAYKDLVNMVARIEQEQLAREQALEQAQAAGEENNVTPRRPLRR
jgi:hypothetical protein